MQARIILARAPEECSDAMEIASRNFSRFSKDMFFVYGVFQTILANIMLAPAYLIFDEYMLL